MPPPRRNPKDTLAPAKKAAAPPPPAPVPAAAPHKPAPVAAGAHPQDANHMTALYGHLAADHDAKGADAAQDPAALANLAIAQMAITNATLQMAKLKAQADADKAEVAKLSSAPGLTQNDYIMTAGAAPGSALMKAFEHKKAVQSLLWYAHDDFDKEKLGAALAGMAPAERAAALADYHAATGENLEVTIADHTDKDDAFRGSAGKLMAPAGADPGKPGPKLSPDEQAKLSPDRTSPTWRSWRRPIRTPAPSSRRPSSTSGWSGSS